MVQWPDPSQGVSDADSEGVVVVDIHLASSGLNGREPATCQELESEPSAALGPHISLFSQHRPDQPNDRCGERGKSQDIAPDGIEIFTDPRPGSKRRRRSARQVIRRDQTHPGRPQGDEIALRRPGLVGLSPPTRYPRSQYLPMAVTVDAGGLVQG